MKIIVGILFIISGISFITPTYAQSTFTLPKCIDYAITHNIELSDLDVQRRDVMIDVNVERGKFLPTINARLTNGISMGFQQVLTKEMAGKYESVSSYNEVNPES